LLLYSTNVSFETKLFLRWRALIGVIISIGIGSFIYSRELQKYERSTSLGEMIVVAN